VCSTAQSSQLRIRVLAALDAVPAPESAPSVLRRSLAPATAPNLRSLTLTEIHLHALSTDELFEDPHFYYSDFCEACDPERWNARTAKRQKVENPSDSNSSRVA
jgi:hypothetical protein